MQRFIARGAALLEQLQQLAAHGRFSASDQALMNCLRSKSRAQPHHEGGAGQAVGERCAHAVDLPLDAIAGDGPLGPALGHHRANPGFVLDGKQGLAELSSRALRTDGHRAHAVHDAARNEASWRRYRPPLLPRTGPGFSAAARMGRRAEEAMAPNCGNGAVPSDSQTLAALGAASVDDGAAATGLHANQKAVGTGAAHFGGLVGAFHVASRENPALSRKSPTPANRRAEYPGTPCAPTRG